MINLIIAILIISALFIISYIVYSYYTQAQTCSNVDNYKMDESLKIKNINYGRDVRDFEDVSRDSNEFVENFTSLPSSDTKYFNSSANAESLTYPFTNNFRINTAILPSSIFENIIYIGTLHNQGYINSTPSNITMVINSMKIFQPSIQPTATPIAIPNTILEPPVISNFTLSSYTTTSGENTIQLGTVELPCNIVSSVHSIISLKLSLFNNSTVSPHISPPPTSAPMSSISLDNTAYIQIIDSFTSVITNSKVFTPSPISLKSNGTFTTLNETVIFPISFFISPGSTINLVFTTTSNISVILSNINLAFSSYLNPQVPCTSQDLISSGSPLSMNYFISIMSSNAPKKIEIGIITRDGFINSSINVPTLFLSNFMTVGSLYKCALNCTLSIIINDGYYYPTWKLQL